MTNSNDNRPVVYYFADAAFAWDIAPLIVDIERRGFRVVKGDNADELLFLLQMGRPAAIVYTLPGVAARALGSFQMVAQRAVDMLVPMVIAGPDDPRDGVLLRYPDGKSAVESHVPFHALGELFVRFVAQPPSTPSRPASFVDSQTFGKGRTMMSWRRSLPPPRFTDLDEPEAPPLVIEPTHPHERTPRDAEESKAPLREPESRGETPKRRSLRLGAVLFGGIAIGLAALIVYFVVSTGRREPAPRVAERPRARASSDASPAASEMPAAAAMGSTDAEQGKAARPIDGGEPERTRRVRSGEIGTANEELLSDPSGIVRFPGHFREETATFWFAGDWEERRFLTLVRSMGPKTVIHLIGRATKDELEMGPANLPLGRARAVEKYLIRNGIDGERIETESGARQGSAGETDKRGLWRDRRVDVRFE